MKALVLREVKQPLVIEERPTPVPGAGEVVVALHAAALNRRDFWITRGLYPGVRTPSILGSDGAGTVTSAGVGVDTAWIGKDVIINPGLGWGPNPLAQDTAFRILGMPDDGTFATEVVVPASQIHAKPQHLDWRESAALPLAGVTAYRALFTQGGVRSGEKVLVTGIGGGVATFALQFALAAGAQVFVTSSSPEKIQKATDLGAESGSNYTAKDWGRLFKSAHGLVDLIIDGAGGEGYEQLLELAAPGGRVVNYGATAGPPARFDLFKVFWKQLRVVGSTMGSPQDFEAMLALVSQHRLHPLVHSVHSLEGGAEAVETMKHSPQFGKLVINVG